MSSIDPTRTLGELVLDDPARAEIFEQLDLDYCCRGSRTLAQACEQRGLDAQTVAAVLASVPAARAPQHQLDAAQASTAELCDHIVEAHHDRLRLELPRLAETVATVVRVHGADDPRLSDLARVYRGLQTELETHNDHEERDVFPACRAVEAGERELDDGLLAELEHEHAEAGEALLVLRDLTDGFDLEHARCGTHRSLLAGLRELERDLHQHIH
jgi:regulator of cell morphogenesis and NO signaling